jgi:hypothetical protein
MKTKNQDLEVILAFIPFAVVGMLLGFCWQPLAGAVGFGLTLTISIILGIAACITTGILLSISTDEN